MLEYLEELENCLIRAPEDWSVRLRLMEARIGQGDLDAARRLVRESPDEAPLPAELQYRVHTLLTQGAAALVPEPEYLPNVRGPQIPFGPPEDHSPEPPEAPAAELPRDPAEMAPVRDSRRRKTKPKPEGWTPTIVPAKKDAPRKTPDEKAPEAEEKIEVPQEEKFRAMPRPKLVSRWEKYRGQLRLEPLTPAARAPREKEGARKISALSFALVLHLAAFVLVGFIVIAVPRPKPPQLIATVTYAEPKEHPTPVRIQKLEDPKPASASAATPNVIGAVGASPVKIPEMENTNAVDVTSMLTGPADVGDGFSFAGDTREASEVNFFGISSGGKRIVFIVDATKEMLVDEKGGMYAYDKVKQEIAAMMAGLNRGTKFNLLLYEGKQLIAFAEEPVTAMPSNLRMAIQWLDPLNRTYENLGLGAQSGEVVGVEDGLEPIAARDVAHYTKAIQKALEWRAESIFCISSGYRGMQKTPTPEEMEKYRQEREKNPGTPGEVSPAEQKAWSQAQQRTRDWLQKENAARREKGLAPKVVLDFNALVQEITGATPPRATGGSQGARRPRPEPHTPDDIETLVRNGVETYYRKGGYDPPSLHMVVFLGEDEGMNDQTRDHFKNLTRKNNGEFKMLRGLAALENVTGKGGQ
ncbi:MAG: tetratricopeptide repeat protein [Verrucomicrobiae bacterium]|nr:tetratricopeptide repeat protein [Verrucomicrobiae bacterium]